MSIKNIFIKFVICIAFVACEPPPEYRTAFTGWQENGNPKCEIQGRNCVLYYPDPLETNAAVTLNNFYNDFSTNNLNHFFQTNNWHQLFPDDYTIHDPEVQKIISGEYETRILGDSSIVILKNPKLGLAVDNVLYVFNRE